jgi:hypothetical protein
MTKLAAEQGKPAPQQQPGSLVAMLIGAIVLAAGFWVAAGLARRSK